MIAQLFGTNKFLDMLGMPKFWFILAVIIGLIVALVYCIKYFNKGGKFVLLTIFIVGMICLSVYSGIQLNYYYNTRGGIYGAITGLFKPNEVQVVEDLSYEFNNIELAQDHGNVYSADIIINEVMKLDKDVVYGVYVNDSPCDYVENASDYVLAKYTYKFYDKDLSEILEDTLTFKFAFYSNSTYLSFSTNGGAEAVKYWNYYFNKNLFVISIKPTQYVVSDDLTYGNGDIENYVTVKFVNNDDVNIQICKKGSLISLPKIDNFKFLGWKVNGEFVTSETYLITDDVEFVASYGVPKNATYTFDNLANEYRTDLKSDKDGELIVPLMVKNIFDASDLIVTKYKLYFNSLYYKGQLYTYTTEKPCFTSEQSPIQEGFINIDNGVYVHVGSPITTPADVKNDFHLPTSDHVYLQYEIFSGVGHGYQLAFFDKWNYPLRINSVTIDLEFDEDCQNTFNFYVDDNPSQTFNKAKGEEFTLPEIPAKEGYEIVGWRDKSTGSLKKAGDSMVSNAYSIDFYAEYTLTKHTIDTTIEYKQVPKSFFNDKPQGEEWYILDGYAINWTTGANMCQHPEYYGSCYYGILDLTQYVKDNIYLSCVVDDFWQTTYEGETGLLDLNTYNELKCMFALSDKYPARGICTYNGKLYLYIITLHPESAPNINAYIEYRN